MIVQYESRTGSAAECATAIGNFWGNAANCTSTFARLEKYRAAISQGVLFKHSMDGPEFIRRDELVILRIFNVQT